MERVKHWSAKVVAVRKAYLMSQVSVIFEMPVNRIATWHKEVFPSAAHDALTHLEKVKGLVQWAIEDHFGT